LIAWTKEKHEQEQQEKWENSTTTMKERKPHHIMNTNTKTMTRREQLHPFCSDGQRTQPGMPLLRIKSHHRPNSMALYKETETKRPQMDITKEIWKGGKQEMEKY
jgi:hypothetical protein